MIGQNRVITAFALAFLVLSPVVAQDETRAIDQATPEGELIPGFIQEFQVDRGDRMMVPVSIAHQRQPAHQRRRRYRRRAHSDRQ